MVDRTICRKTQPQHRALIANKSSSGRDLRRSQLVGQFQTAWQVLEAGKTLASASLTHNQITHL
jgi:hypothetical protein